MATLMMAVVTGARDGWDSPHDLGMGMTYGDHRANEAYDRAVNVGQRLGRTLRRR